MRIEFSGSLVRPTPVILSFSVNDTLSIADYIALGYTHFDVICIGAGGGRGGEIDTLNAGTTIRNFGGAGGGGGFHRARGLLSALPDTCAVVVGQAGAHGQDNVVNPALTTNGEDGGYSSFNDTTCRASGGKGGKRVQSNSDTVSTQADGGEGGIGNSIVAGGGANGGTAGTPSATGPGTPGTNGADGTLIGDIGRGGGGGAGGVGKYNGTTCVQGTAGGKGSYNPSDTSAYGPSFPQTDALVADGSSVGTVAGIASGAKGASLNSLPTIYGASGYNGRVIIRLTAE